MKNLLTTVKFQDIGQVFLQFASGEATMVSHEHCCDSSAYALIAHRCSLVYVL